MNPLLEREKGLLELERRINDLRSANAGQPIDMSAEIASLENKYRQLLAEVFGSLTPWEKVHMARHPGRPTALDYIAQFDCFDELHGDRQFRDDLAIVGGLARLGRHSIVAIGQQRGRDMKENLARNFGMAAPEGYRKGERLARLAERFNLPLLTFVDTKGADPGILSEEHAQAEAIASSLATFAALRVPTICVVIGEGGSGGALALAIADRVLMLEHSVYSVASPEGCAAILWGDAGKAEEAAAHLKLTAQDLRGFGIADEVIPEPVGGAHRDGPGTVRRVLDRVGGLLDVLNSLEMDALLDARYEKYRRLGSWRESALRVDRGT